MIQRLLLQAGRGVRMSCPVTLSSIIYREGLTNQINRAFSSTGRNCNENVEDPSGSEGLTGEASKLASGLKDRIFEVERYMAVVKSQLGDIKRDIKDLRGEVKGDIKDLRGEVKDIHKKVDSMFFCLVLLMAGGVIARGAFDFYRDERAWNRTAQVKGLDESVQVEILTLLRGLREAKAA